MAQMKRVNWRLERRLSQMRRDWERFQEEACALPPSSLIGMMAHRVSRFTGDYSHVLLTRNEADNTDYLLIRSGGVEIGVYPRDEWSRLGIAT